MNKFLQDKSARYFEVKQKFIKETIICTLSENLKLCEYISSERKEILGISDATSSLCSTLEAIFLHGLKDTFLQLTFSILDSDIDRRPNPSFWNAILLFLHKEVIQEIQALTQINTDTGRSRTFIRKGLNEKVLSSYFMNIRKSSSSLKSYYHRYAILCDEELVETIENLLMGVESYVEFDLPCNSSLLNTWNDAPLSLSGLYSAPLRSLPIASGEDVAGSLSTASQSIDIPNRVTNLSDIYSASISNSIFTNSPVSFSDEDDRMTRLLLKVDSVEDGDAAEEDEESQATELFEVSEQISMKEQEEKISTFQESFDDSISDCATMGNSISGKQTWSEPQKEQFEEEPESEQIVFKQKTTSRLVLTDNQTFESLWNEKKRRSTLNFKEVWDRFETSTLRERNNSATSPEDHEMAEGFEIVKPQRESLQQLQSKVEVLCRLSSECGLDSQGFLCKECKAPLGVDFSKSNVCAFDGHYYCSACISIDKYPIPAKIIYNWDFEKYTVSEKTAAFLNDYQFQPFIDFKILNPDIYSYIEVMNRLQKLRIQLNFIRAYIFTCSESTISELQKLLYGKEYIYESIHFYSIADLSLIPNNALEEMLKRVVALGKSHCLKCALCSMKGFICEYCRKSKVIYPFDVDETYRCNSCGSVSHINCFDPTINCPKCERKSKRLTNAIEIKN